ncbi:hypothetical protein O181_034564 [Austropuccinia psidii MF-1]|uniref:Uncharacterized protein n=1 Tax=Austropuccinia psidii MF-1 TaxID=1389203 RepID=A0A9Q3D102_9BASI|nr:hypothetical protein [Austropuccinia psidii MF-1]
MDGIHLWKSKHDACNRRMEGKSPPPPKQVPKKAPIARNRNSNAKKKPQAENKGKGKAPATKPYIQHYRMPWKICFRWPEL